MPAHTPTSLNQLTDQGSYGSNSAVSGFLRHGCSTPETGHSLVRLARPKSAKTGREQMQQPNVPMHGYSITSSARASSVCGTPRPSVFAVFKLITSSYLVGA